MAKQALAILLFILATSGLANAQEYYADVIVTVDKTGMVEISGISNHPGLQPTRTQNLTSKEGMIWTLNISPEGTFSDFVYEIRFPQETAIRYLNVPNLLSIGMKNGYLSASGTGTNETFFIIAQYSFENAQDTSLYLIMSAMAVAVISVILFIMKGIKHAKEPLKSMKPIASINTNSLTERQRKIYEILSKTPAGITQSELQKSTGIPKASLSRNLKALARKGIITQEEKGMTNFISLKTQR